jgi:hypothetical protein
LTGDEHLAAAVKFATEQGLSFWNAEALIDEVAEIVEAGGSPTIGVYMRATGRSA